MRNQELIREMKEVIENAITQSMRVMRALRRLKQAGYDIRLGISVNEAAVAKVNPTLRPETVGSTLLVLTELDGRFLKALRIKADQ